ncbi:MAG TPA: hypothetical protein VNC12_06790 [Solirubrobacteraceae bacterium]|nr:hypothetical protein [Solirubrobacteraceae bacterium]
MADAAFDRFPSRRRRRSIPALDGGALRIRLWLTRGRLDQQIVSGCACWANAAVAWRARQLSDPRTRRRHARNLREVVAYADRAGSRPPFSAVVTVCAAVRADREAILGLAERLEAPGPVNPRGIVLVARFLTDGIDSPLFNARCTRTVTEAVWDISDALREDDPPTVAFDVVAC